MFNFSLVVNIFAAIGALLAAVASLYIYWDSSSPDVQAYLETDNDANVTFFIAKNFGKKPAYDVTFDDFNYDVVQPDYVPYLERSFLALGIPILAPGQWRCTIICNNKYASENFINTCAQGHVIFNKKSLIGKRRLISCYSLDYYSFANTITLKK